MDQSKRRRDFARGIARSFLRPAEPFAIRNARKIDARGVQNHTWIVSDGKSIVATGTSDDDFEVACRHLNIANAATSGSAAVAADAAITDAAITDAASADAMPASAAITDAAGAIMTPDMLTFTPMVRGARRSMTVRKESKSLVPGIWPMALRGRCLA